MKPKMIILILLSSLILGCRTAKKDVHFTKEGRTEIERVKSDTSTKEKVKSEDKNHSEHDIKSISQKFSGDIIIKGKSDSINPFIFHNILNGDTLQSISIKGNADYYINNHYSKSKEQQKETKTEEKLSNFQKFARESVSKETITEVASKVKEVNKTIKSTGFQAGAYITFIIWGAVAIALIVLLLWLRKTEWVQNILNRFNKRR